MINSSKAYDNMGDVYVFASIGNYRLVPEVYDTYRYRKYLRYLIHVLDKIGLRCVRNLKDFILEYNMSITTQFKTIYG